MSNDKHQSILDSDDDESDSKIISPAVKPPKSEGKKEENILRSTPQFRYTPKKMPTPEEKYQESPKPSYETPKKPSIKSGKAKIPSYINRTPMPDEDDADYIESKVSSLISSIAPPNYDLETEEIKLRCYEGFKAKFMALKTHYPERVPEFPEGRSITTVHKTYRTLIKDIWVSMNVSQIRSYYTLLLMGIEFLCVKFLGLPMAGFFKTEVKRMHKYDMMMIEIGNEYYKISGGNGESENGWGVGYRMAFSLAFNIFIFLALKYAMKYFAGDAGAGISMDMVRSFIDDMSNNDSTPSDVEEGVMTEQQGAFDGGNGNFISGLFSSYTDREEKKQANKKPAAPKSKKFHFVDD